MGYSKRIELPPGYSRTESQWVCNCPFCGKVEHFEWNLDFNAGYCWVCKSYCQDLAQLQAAFAGKLSHVQIQQKLRNYKVLDTCGIASAWEHRRSREWCISKGYREVAVRETKISYDPDRDHLIMPIESPSHDIGNSWIYRPLWGQKQKWCHLGGAKAAYYGWGVRRFEDTGRPVLLVEGMSDLLCTELYDYGLAMLGSAMKSHWFWWLKSRVRTRKVFMWFDADKAGEEAYTEGERLCHKYKLPFFSIRSKLDPKYYTPDHKDCKDFLNRLRGLLS